MPTLSVVLPIFNEEVIIPELYRRLTSALENCHESYELLFVNDGSRDNSFALLCDLADRDNRVKVVSFSRNFGHQIAITAGSELRYG